MGISECTDEISLYNIVFAIVLIPILIICIRKIFKKLRSGTEIYKYDITDTLKLATDLVTELNEYDQKTSAGGQMALGDPSFAHLQEWCAAFRDQTLASLEEEHAKTAKKFEELEQNIENFEQETPFFRETLELVTEDEEFYENEMNRRLVEISTQNRRIKDEYFGNVVEHPSLEAFDTETCNVLLFDIKDCMDQIVNESKWNFKNNPVLEISTFVKQQYQNLEELLNFIMNERQLQMDILSVEAEVIEKQFLDIFIFLNRKFVDVEAIAETLKFFNRKFINFADKCEIKWDHSCSSLDATRDTIYEAKANLSFSCSRMSRISCFLSQQTEDLKESRRMLGDAVQWTTAIAERESLENKRMEVVFDVVENMKGVLAKIEEGYCLKMRDISESLETPKQTLEYFVRYVENLEFLDDLLKSIAKKYEGTIAKISACEQGDNSRLEDATDNETVSIMSGDGLSSSQCGEGFNEFWSEVNRSKHDKSDHSKNDSSKEIGTHLTLKRMASVFHEVIRKNAVEPVEKDDGSLKSNFSLKRDIIDKLGREGFDWSFVSSEDSLSDVNNDCLIGSSSEDEEEGNV